MDKSLAPSLIDRRQLGSGLVRVRFVGGPWHNRIEEVSPRAGIGVEYIDADHRDRRVAKYFLCYLETECGTRYAEYVCETLFTADGELLDEVADGHQVVRLPSILPRSR